MNDFERLIHDIFCRVNNMQFSTISDITIFKNIGNLYIKQYGDAADFEDKLDTLIQKLDSNIILFGYMQYIESAFDTLKEFLTLDQLQEIIDAYTSYNFNNDLTYPTIDAIRNISVDNADFHMRILIKIMAFRTYSKLKNLEKAFNATS